MVPRLSLNEVSANGLPTVSRNPLIGYNKDSDMAILNENGTGVAGGHPPPLVLGNMGISTMGFLFGSSK